MTENTAVVVRSDVLTKSTYSSYREELRFDFIYSCAYCSATEIEAHGFGFEIDHYYPQSTHPYIRSDYCNLMWSCERCNLYKSDYDPDAEDDDNNEIIRVDIEDPDDFMHLAGKRLEPKNPKGEFNIDHLMLNRHALQRIRDLRSRLTHANETI